MGEDLAGAGGPSTALGTVCDMGLSAQDGSRAKLQQGEGSHLLIPPLPDRHLATAQDPEGESLKLLRDKYQWRH